MRLHSAMRRQGAAPAPTAGPTPTPTPAPLDDRCRQDQHGRGQVVPLCGAVRRHRGESGDAGGAAMTPPRPEREEAHARAFAHSRHHHRRRRRAPQLRAGAERGSPKPRNDGLEPLPHPQGQAQFRSKVSLVPSVGSNLHRQLKQAVQQQYQKTDKVRFSGGPRLAEGPGSGARDGRGRARRRARRALRARPARPHPACLCSNRARQATEPRHARGPPQVRYHRSAQNPEQEKLEQERRTQEMARLR
jgi:hypothetical protein